MANQNQKNIVKSGLFNTFLFSRKIINPRRDWTALVIFLSVLVVGALAFDGLMYKKIASGDMYVSVERSELNLQPLRAAQIRQIIDDYASRAGNISSIRTKNFIDPSL